MTQAVARRINRDSQNHEGANQELGTLSNIILEQDPLLRLGPREARKSRHQNYRPRGQKQQRHRRKEPNENAGAALGAAKVSQQQWNNEQLVEAAQAAESFLPRDIGPQHS